MWHQLQRPDLPQNCCQAVPPATLVTDKGDGGRIRDMEGNSGPSGVRWGKELLVIYDYTALSIMKSFP